MAFKFPKTRREVAFMEHISTEVLIMCSDCVGNGKKIDIETYKGLRLNSFEDKFITPHLSDEAFAHRFGLAKAQVRDKSSWELCITYEEYLTYEGSTELLKRFNNLLAENMYMYSALLDAANLGSDRAKAELQRIAKKDALEERIGF